MEGTNKKVCQIKLVQSKTTNIRIHDRRTFKRNSDQLLLDKLQNSHEQKDVAEGAAERRNNIKLKVKLRQRPKLKQVKTCYDVSTIKNIVNTMDDELLALIVMNADAEKVFNGFKKLLAEQIEEK